MTSGKGLPRSLWTIEEACRNAYPAREILIDGWLLRAAGGRSRRTNSVNPLSPDSRDLAGVVATAEAVYGSLGQPVLFRVPDLAPAMDDVLDRLGYGREGETRTLWADLPAPSCASAAGVTLASRPDAAWYEAWRVLNAGVSAVDAAAFRASVDAILLPGIFAVRRVNGEAAALAYGVVDRRILVIEAVVTDPRRRRVGHGRAILEALLGAAGPLGAAGACLQVAADNAPALALYAAVGFDRTLYGYHYRVAPPRSRIVVVPDQGGERGLTGASSSSSPMSATA